MNGTISTIHNPLTAPRRAVSTFVLCAALVSVAQPVTAQSAFAIAANTQAASAAGNDSASAVVTDTEASLPTNTTPIQTDTEEADPDAGTLAVLAIGLIALGLTRRKVRN